MSKTNRFASSLILVLALMLAGAPAAFADEGKDESGKQSESKESEKNDESKKNEAKGDAESAKNEGDNEERDDDPAERETDDSDDAGSEKTRASSTDDDDARSSTTQRSRTVQRRTSGDEPQGNVPCPAGTIEFKIDRNPGDGTFSDGTLTVTISGNDGDSFNWSSNIPVDSVLVKGGPVTQVNAGGTSGTATSAFNPSSGESYGISHVSFCYTTDAVGGGEQKKLCPPGTDNAGMEYQDIADCDDDVEGRTDKVCPAGTDKAGKVMDDLDDCDKDGVEGRTDKVCPPGTDFAGVAMGDLDDCVLGTIISRSDPEDGIGPSGAALPFTGTGGTTTFVALGGMLIALGALTLRSRKKT